MGSLFFTEVAAIPLQINSNDIHTAGQKETDIFDQEPVTIPISSVIGKFKESSSVEEDTDETPISRNPTAHAIFSPAKSERIHDSLADIYLTGTFKLLDATT